MSNVATNSKRFEARKTLLAILVFVALVLSVYVIYKLTNHSTDNFSIPNHQTKLDRPLKSTN